MRTVTIKDVHSGEVFGTATLGATGAATITGFDLWPEIRRAYRESGIKDRRKTGGQRMVPLSEGETFLDLLVIDFDGRYIRAFDSEAAR